MATPGNLVVHEGIREAWSRLSPMLSGEGYSILLVGDPGTGKTRMLATVLHGIEAKWPHGRYVYWTMPAFVDARRHAVSGDAQDPVEPCIEAHVCVLDDLGAEKVTDYGLEGFYRVVDERKKRHQITLMATNLPLAARRRDERTFPSVYGDRIVSRMFGEHGTVVRVSGTDWRTQQAKQVTPIRWADQIGKPAGMLAEIMRQRERAIEQREEA